MSKDNDNKGDHSIKEDIAHKDNSLQVNLSPLKNKNEILKEFNRLKENTNKIKNISINPEIGKTIQTLTNPIISKNYFSAERENKYKYNKDLSHWENLRLKLEYKVNKGHILGTTASQYKLTIQHKEDIVALRDYIDDVNHYIMNSYEKEDIKVKLEFDLSKIHFKHDKSLCFLNELSFMDGVLRFDDCKFSCDFEITSETKLRDISINNAIFEKGLLISGFKKNLELGALIIRKSKINHSIEINNININDYLTLSNNEISNNLTIYKTQVDAEIDISFSKIRKDFKLQDATFSHSADLSGIEIHRNLKIFKTIFNSSNEGLDLTNARCLGKVSFNDVSFNLPPRVYEFKVSSEMEFNNCIFLRKGYNEINSFRYLSELMISKKQYDMAQVFHSYHLTAMAKGDINLLVYRLKAMAKASAPRYKWYNPFNILVIGGIIQHIILKSTTTVFEVLFSVAYIAINVRGQWPLLPLVWIILMTTIIPMFEYQNLTITENFCTHINWKCGVHSWSDYEKALFHSLQSTFWPIKVISGDSIFVEQVFSDKVRSFTQSLASTLLFYFLFIGVKNKFRIEGLR